MREEILAHKKFVQAEVARISKLKNVSAREISARNLLNFHEFSLRNFQHERFVHLIITLFFAVLMLIFWAIFAVWLIFFAPSFSANLFDFSALFSPNSPENLITFSLAFLVLILTILEFFYIRHYYFLENRTQNLYNLTREIYNVLRFDKFSG